MKIGVKNIILTIMALFITGVFFLNSFQGYRYERLKTKVEIYEEEQKRWFEENKKMLTALSVFNSPERIRKISEDMGLKNSSAGQNIIIHMKDQKGMDEEKGE